MTAATDTGEELARAAGTFDPRTGRWTVRHETWFKSGVSAGVETRTLTPRGRLLLATTEAEGGQLETRPVYGDDGTENWREIWWVPGPGAGESLQSLGEVHDFSRDNWFALTDKAVQKNDELIFESTGIFLEVFGEIGKCVDGSTRLEGIVL